MAHCGQRDKAVRTPVNLSMRGIDERVLLAATFELFFSEKIEGYKVNFVKICLKFMYGSVTFHVRNLGEE